VDGLISPKNAGTTPRVIRAATDEWTGLVYPPFFLALSL